MKNIWGEQFDKETAALSVVNVWAGHVLTKSCLNTEDSQKGIDRNFVDCYRMSADRKSILK